jgi:hypothetical protein
LLIKTASAPVENQFNKDILYPPHKLLSPTGC